MLCRRNMFSILFYIAAAAALTIPPYPARSTPLDFRGAVGSRHHSINAPAHLQNREDASKLQLHIQNKLQKTLYAYISGTVDGKYALVAVNGTESFFTYIPPAQAGVQSIALPNFQYIEVPPEGKDITIPGYISTARVYISETPTLEYRANFNGGVIGLQEPDFLNKEIPGMNTSWGFMEFDHKLNNLFIDITYVDFVGLPLGISMTYKIGDNQTTETIPGLHKDSVEKICDALSSIPGQDGVPWADLCYKDSNGNPLRVLAPEKYMSNHNGSGFETYYDPYVDAVWAKYANEDLTIDTQDRSGQAAAQGVEIPCRVSKKPEGNAAAAGDLVCRAADGTDAATFRKPTARDIFGCAGAFASVAGNALQERIAPRLCAAFSRSTLLLDSHPMEVAAQEYYGHAITNFYAKFVHQNLAGGKGYAFPYDDVNMDPTDPNENSAGTIQQPNPVRLDIMVGGDDA